MVSFQLVQTMVNTFTPIFEYPFSPLFARHYFLITLVQEFGFLSQYYIFFTSHHLSAGYCMDIVRRNSSLVTPGNEKVRKTQGQLPLMFKEMCIVK